MGVLRTPVSATGLDWSQLAAGRWRTATSGAIREILAVASAADVISFAGGFPDPATFPTAVLPDLVESVIAGGAADALQYAPTQGLASVRAFLTDRVHRLEGVRPGPDELMVTSGSMEAMELIALSLIDPGDLIVVEGPSFVGALLAFRSLEAELESIPIDAGGLDTDRLESRLQSGLRPKIVYTIPDFQNPSGVTLPVERRLHLLELADRYGFVVAEDIAYRELWFDRPPGPSLWSERPDLVVQFGTFSKLFFPGVRLGWAVGPEPLVARMVGAKQTTDQCAGALGQRLVEEYGRRGLLDEQVAQSRTLYRGRRDSLLAQLDRRMSDAATWTRPEGGFFTWLTVDRDVDTVELAKAARDRKVAFVPGAVFHVDDGGRRSVRLSFSRVSDDDIDTGVERLAGVLADQ